MICMTLVLLSLPKSFVMSCLLSMPVSVAAFAGVLNVINNNNSDPVLRGSVLARQRCASLGSSRVKMICLW